MHQAERLLHEKYAAVGERPPTAVADLGPLELAVQTLRQEYQQQLQHIQEEYDPEFDPDRTLSPIGFEAIRQLLPVDVPTAIVHYSLGVEHAFAVIITANAVRPVRLPDLDERKAMELALAWLRG